jgi:TonB family protein
LQGLDQSSFQVEIGGVEVFFKYLILLLLFVASPDARQIAIVHFESPEYPRLAWQARIHGDVNVTAHIASDGKVSSASASSGHQLLQEAALENIKKWVFAANREFDLEIVYQFKLEKPESGSQHATKVVIDLPSHRVMVICNLPQLNT